MEKFQAQFSKNCCLFLTIHLYTILMVLSANYQSSQVKHNLQIL